jgi:chemotaxis protein CheC
MNLSETQLDSLKEIINIGIGKSASVLNKVVKNRVQLKVPTVQIIKISELSQKIGYSKDNMLSIISMDFKGELMGKVELIFTSSSAVKIVDLLTDKDYLNLEMDQLRSSTLSEVGNIVLNSLIGTMGNLLKTRFKYSIPKFKECVTNDVGNSYNSTSDFLIFAETHFSVKDINIDGSFILFFELATIDRFFELLNQSIK